MRIPEIKFTVERTPGKIITIKSASDCARWFRKIIGKDEIHWREHFVMLCLSRSSQVIGFARVSMGGVNSTIVDPKVVFQMALNCNASAIIVGHNHPSGKTEPSADDIRVTAKLKQGADFLEIQLVDHIIFTEKRYYSFEENQLLKSE